MKENENTVGPVKATPQTAEAFEKMSGQTPTFEYDQNKGKFVFIFDNGCFVLEHCSWISAAIMFVKISVKDNAAKILDHLPKH